MTKRHGSEKKRPGSKNEPPVTVVPVESFKTIEEATGTDNPDLQQRLFNQVYDTLWLPEGLSDEERMARIRSAISMLQGIKPTDEIEGMLAAQMVSTHNVTMDCLRRAMIQGQTFEGRDQNMKHATKLLSIYSRQIEVLNKHRGKGQQKVTVEYVNVESGGQAVVGHIEAGLTAESPRNNVNPKPTAITNNPAEILDMDFGSKKPEPHRKS
jgi:hypothetical protein